jgi:superfamily II DNA helicase RecQ
MQYHFFWIPVCHGEWAQRELNSFLAGNPASSVEKHFVNNGSESGWAVSVMVLRTVAGGGASSAAAAAPADSARIDYRELLSPEDFEIFSQLRVWRKERGASEGIPIYAVGTNEQLAAIAQRRPQTRQDLEAIEGLGKTRVKRYADEVLQLVAAVVGRQAAITES